MDPCEPRDAPARLHHRHDLSCTAVSSADKPANASLAGLGTPALSAARVELRPPMPGDLEWLYAAACHPTVGLTWRLMGAIPSIDRFATVLWAGVETQFVLWSRDGSARRLGLVQMIRYDPRSATAHLSFFLESSHQNSGWPLEGVLLFVDYIFRVYPLRKLYLESLRPVFDRFGSAVGRHLEVEGVLRDHDVLDGQFVDLVIASATPAQWAESREKFAL